MYLAKFKANLTFNVCYLALSLFVTPSWFNGWHDSAISKVSGGTEIKICLPLYYFILNDICKVWIANHYKIS